VSPRTVAARPPQPKLQRWVDLLAALLRRHFAVTFEEIVREVPAYQAAPSDEALMRMFERDKDELRAFGVPIRTDRSPDGEMSGYRVDRREFYLPYLALAAAGTVPTAPKKVGRDGYRALRTIAFTPDELAAMAEGAARAASLGDPRLAGDARSAMRKLAFDLPADAMRADDSVRVVSADRKADAVTFAALGDALLRRKRVTFGYRTMETDTEGAREVEPYGMFFTSGHWYLTGMDRGRAALRTFRVDRVRYLEVNGSKANSADFEVPEGFSARAHAARREPWGIGDGDAVRAVVELRGGAGTSLDVARLGEPIDGEPSHRAFVVRRPDAFARWLLTYGGDVVPLSPPAVVDACRRVAAETVARCAEVAS
jgi:proteasome accessory factor B